MASAEQTPTGPRYAPDDPTLPQPWKGLIDGSTGVHYYWNPDTNLTQYERPSSLPTPLTPGQPPASAPATGPTSGSNTQPGAVAGQVCEHVQTQVHQGLQTGSHLQNSQQMPQIAQQNNSVSPQAGQQQGPVSTQQPAQQYMQQPYEQYPPQQQMPHHQFPGQQMSFYQGPQMGQYQGQFPHSQMPYMGYQQNSYPQGPQNSQRPPFPHPQGHNTGLQQREETDSQQGKQMGLSLSQNQYPGGRSFQNHPQGANTIQMQPQMCGQPDQVQTFASSPLKMLQPAPRGQFPQNINDLVSHQQGPGFQNQFEPGMMRGQQPLASPINSNVQSEESMARRAGNKYYMDPANNGPGMPPQQPKLAAIPMARNHPQDMRFGGAPIQTVAPGIASGPNSAPPPGLPNAYGPPAGGQGLQVVS